VRFGDRADDRQAEARATRGPAAAGIRAVKAREHLAGGVSVPGGGARTIAIASALVAGTVLAIVLIPHFSAWGTHVGLAREH
jgi:hypothetical protein